MTLFLGVDGGGSKTAFVLLNDSGQIVGQTQSRSCYYFSEGIGLVSSVLTEGIDALTTQVGIETKDIGYAFFGLPGYGEVSTDIAELDAIPHNILGHSRYSCDNDMVCGWAGSLGAIDGINVISGTGSMTYGEHDGHGHRVGGWSELFGDEGSAYWVAIRGLNAYTRMSDGRLPRGPLYEVVKKRVDVTGDLDLIDVVVNRWKGQRGAIADLSKTVVEAAALGDLVAAQIITDACSELATIVDTTRTELGFAPEDIIPVSYSGGMFTASAVREGFEEALTLLHPNYELRTPQFNPAVGAALYAAKKAGTPLTDRALANLRSS